MRIKTVCSLQTRKAMACARNRANRPWMKSSTCRTAHTWKNMIRGSWLDVSLFSHVRKAIRDIWLVYFGLRTKIYSAAFQRVNLSMYIINRDYFMESACVRDFHTSWWSIWNRTSERSERVRFLIQNQRVWKSRTKRFPCSNFLFHTYWEFCYLSSFNWFSKIITKLLY